MVGARMQDDLTCPLIGEAAQTLEWPFDDVNSAARTPVRRDRDYKTN
jgi:hypothetical protein